MERATPDVLGPTEVMWHLIDEVAQHGDREWTYNTVTGEITRPSTSLLNYVQILLEDDETFIAVQCKVESRVSKLFSAHGFDEDSSQPQYPSAFVKKLKGRWQESGLGHLNDALVVAIQLAKLVCSSDSPSIELVVTSRPLTSMKLPEASGVRLETCENPELEQLRLVVASATSASSRKHQPLAIVDSPTWRTWAAEEIRAEDESDSEFHELQSESFDEFLDDLNDEGWMLESTEVRIPKTAQDFEAVCCEFLKAIGCEDAELTRRGPDGGVDVVSPNLVAQAKFHPSQKIAVEVVRALAGSRLEYSAKHALLFHYGPGFTQEAINTATKLNILLFELDVDARRFRNIDLRSRDS